ncbi:MAG: protein kinase [Planctomycetota bacterium]
MSDPKQSSDAQDPTRLLRASSGASRPARPDDEARLATVREAFPDLEIERCIGEGGMATVYRARQPKLDRMVALKVLKQELAEQPEFQARFEREARALASLDHPRILRVIDFGERQSLLYLVTDYVDGADLRRLLELGQLGPEESLRLAPQICEALRYAHMHGVVHRDIKPENILVDLDGNVRIADFGLARIVHGDQAPEMLTRTTQVLGTPHYMAPEQWRAGKDVDHRADIFSLGVVLYEMLTGKLPIGDFPSPSAQEGVSPRLDKVVRRALAQDPDNRFQHVQDMETELDRADGSDAPAGTADAGASTAEEHAGADGVKPRHGSPTGTTRMRSLLRVTLPLGGLAFAMVGTAAMVFWLVHIVAEEPHWRMDSVIGIGGLNVAAAVACGLAGRHVLIDCKHRILHEINALAVWIGPCMLFAVLLIGGLLRDPEDSMKTWQLVAIGGMLAAATAAFIWWRARVASNRAAARASDPAS